MFSGLGNCPGRKMAEHGSYGCFQHMALLPVLSKSTFPIKRWDLKSIEFSDLGLGILIPCSSGNAVILAIGWGAFGGRGFRGCHVAIAMCFYFCSLSPSMSVGEPERAQMACACMHSSISAGKSSSPELSMVQITSCWQELEEAFKRPCLPPKSPKCHQ